MSKRKTTPEPAPEVEPEEEAFIGSKIGPTLFDEPLRAYSPSRRVAAQSMGCLYPFIGDDGAAQFERTGIYPGAVKDAAIVLWLCSLEDASEQTSAQVKGGAWNPSKAMHRPEAALGAALEWAEELELITVGTERFSQAFGEFVKIVTAVEKSKFTIHVENLGGSDDAGEKI